MSGAGHYRAGAVLIVVGGLAAAAMLLLVALSSVRLGEQRPTRRSAAPPPAVAATPTVPDATAAAAAPGPVPEPLPLAEVVMHPTHHLGTPIRVSGQVAIPPGIAAGQIVLYHLADACCESDAVPLALVVQLPAGAALPEVGSWQEATGVLSLTTGGTTPGPLLTASQLYHRPPPAETTHDHP